VVLAADCQGGDRRRPQRRHHSQTHEEVKYLGGDFSPSFRSTIPLFSARFSVIHTQCGDAGVAMFTPPKAVI
jgi:hypothetical protein